MPVISDGSSLARPLAVRQFAMIGSFVIDVAISEEHEFSADVTDYPVEQAAKTPNGPSVYADNIRNKPFTITMECLVSNGPIGEMVDQRKSLNGASPVDAAYDYLQQLRLKREPTTLATSLRNYGSMAIESLSITRTAGSGDALHWTAKLKRIEIRKNTRGKRTSTPIAKGGGQTTKALNPYNGTTFNVVKYTGVNSVETWYWFDKSAITWRSGAIPPDAGERTGQAIGNIGALLVNGTKPNLSAGWQMLANGTPFEDTPDGQQQRAAGLQPSPLLQRGSGQSESSRLGLVSPPTFSFRLIQRQALTVTGTVISSPESAGVHGVGS